MSTSTPSNNNDKTTTTAANANNSCVRYSTIYEFMNMDYNDRYRCIEFYGGSNKKAFTEPLDVLKVSRHGALHIKTKDNTYQVLPANQSIEIDDFKKIVTIGAPTSYIRVDFPYSSVFYI
jgi:hypothetical protein